MRQSNNTPLPTTLPLQTLRERIEQCATAVPHVRCAQHPRPSMEVRDSSNLHIHVSFSSEAEFCKRIQVAGKGASA
jgi:hypothetical protein